MFYDQIRCAQVSVSQADLNDSDVHEYCVAHKIHFVALGEPGSWDAKDRFWALVLDDMDRRKAVSLDDVLQWKRARERAMQFIGQRIYDRGQYRHYKGGLYTTLMLATEEATGTQVVVYQAEKDKSIWTRPAENFFSIAYVNAEPVPRFAYIGQGRA